MFFWTGIFHGRRTIRTTLGDDLARSFRYGRRHVRIFGLCAAVFIPLATYVDLSIGDSQFDTLPARVLAGLVALPLVFTATSLWSRYPRMTLGYWMFAMTYTFPFLYGLLLMGTAAVSAPGEPIAYLWHLQYLVALFIFTQLASSVWLASVGWMVASGSAALMLLALPGVNWDAVYDVFVLPMSLYLTTVVVGSITNRNVEMAQAESIAAAHAVGSNIAHELRTPLVGIGARARASNKLMAQVLAVYRQQQSLNGSDNPAEAQRLRYLEEAFGDIEQEAEHAGTVISMLLTNTSDRPFQGLPSEPFSAAHCASCALQRYPFSGGVQRARVTLKIESDFEVCAPELLVIHVLYNLLKNALYHVERAGDGAVQVTVRAIADPHRQSGEIEVFDTGPGIAPEHLPRIFERFFTTSDTGHGSGIGLSFCKMVMDKIGGDVLCASQAGAYTCFRLTFPVVSAPASGLTDPWVKRDAWAKRPAR